ncbi:MAG: quinoprotein dehydrogenase-associated SoxYZ-like carrier [Gammaproteobacteria bacterium]
MRNSIVRTVKIFMLMLLTMITSAAWAADRTEVSIWDTFLKDQYFKGIDLIEDKTVVDMTTPYRAEDASVTPISITAQIPQTKDLFIEKIYLIVDKNPEPLVGVFNMSPDMGKADLAMRIRIDQYTNVRVIAALNTGEHHMVTNFVKAQGGCSAPLAADLAAAMERMGNMKFRTIAGEGDDDGTSLSQYMVSHPNITGMQLDQRTRLITPAHYIKKVSIAYNDKPIMSAEVGISISADPSFRFFIKPEGKGKITATVSDSDGLEWVESFDVEG